MNLLQKLIQFFINLIGPKTTKTPKTAKTPKITKLNKIPSSTKISQRSSLDVQLKPVEQIPETAIPFSPIIITVSKKDIPKLEPGYVIDANTLMNYEDYPEIKKYGRDVVNKLRDEPIYVLSISNKEYIGKKCPKNRDEQVRDVPYTGRPRNFDNTLAELQKSLGVEIYYVEVENSPEIRRSAKKLLPDLKMFGLHEPDSTYLAFTQFTKSTMITSDGALNKCCLQAQCAKSIEFQEFIDKIMQPSPITIVLRERRNYYKNRKHPHWEKGVFTKF